MKKYTRFNLIFLGSALSTVLAIAGFNVIVDPYGIFHNKNFPKWNQLKPLQMRHDRLLKAIEITRLHPQIILLGSSRTQIGLNPNHPVFKNQNVYNVGLQGGSMYEALRYFEHALSNQKNIQKVILGIDFLMFNEFREDRLTFEENILGKQRVPLQEAGRVLFSLDVLADSQKTIEVNLQGSADDIPTFTKGMLVFDRQKILPGSPQKFLKEVGQQFRYKNQYKISQNHLNSFKKLVEICQAKGIDLKIFISPLHASQLEAIRLQEHWQVLEQWKREIVEIVPVWDFSGYNRITTEPIKNEMKNYRDSSHYLSPVGDLVINRILNYQGETVPADFGVFITTENIDRHLENIRLSREEWAKNNANEVKLVADLKKKIARSLPPR